MENNYEQKYKKALDNARLMYDAGNNDVKHIVGQLFPELAESEDEKVRKEIIRFIRMEVEDEIVGNKWLAWLGKQGEKKASYTTIAKTGDGGINALVTGELPTDSEQKTTDKVMKI